MRAVSADLRLRIHEACQAGESTAAVAERFAVSPAFVRRLKQRFRLTGSLAPKPRSGGPALKLAAHEGALRRAVRERPDATPAEHKDRLNLPASTTGGRGERGWAGGYSFRGPYLLSRQSGHGIVDRGV